MVPQRATSGLGLRWMCTQPARVSPVRPIEEPAAFRAEASEEPVSDRCDVADIDRKKREPDRPSGVADQDPAVESCRPRPG